MSAVAAAELAEVIIAVAGELPEHRPRRSDLWDGCAAWFDQGAPNSLLGQAVAKFDELRDAFEMTFTMNAGLPSQVLPRLGVDLPEPWAAWFDAITAAEDRGASWGAVLAQAGPRPVTVPPVDGIYPGIPDTVYHADTDSLSSSGARTLLQPGGAAKFAYRRGSPPPPSDVFDLGHAVHTRVLGEGGEFVDTGFDAWTTKAAKESRDVARAEGKVPLKSSDYRRVIDMSDAVLTHKLGKILFADGFAEMSIYHHDDLTGVRLRARPDFMPATDRPVIVDLKTTTSADPDEFVRKSVPAYGYHQQDPWYRDVVRSLGDEGEEPQFFFVLVEKTPPYLASVVELPDEAVQLGRRLNRHAVDLYARCVTTGEWPGYEEIIHRRDVPEWVYRAGDFLLRRPEVS